MEENIEPKIISIEGKCGVGKTTWLKGRGIDTEETVDFKVDTRTHNAVNGMIPLEEQLEFVTHKIDQFNMLLEDLETKKENIYIDGSMLYNTAYGAAYYWWYHLTKKNSVEGKIFVDRYLDTCYNLIDSNLPRGWESKLQSIILIPEKDEDIRERILKRGRPSEVSNIDNMLEVNHYFITYLLEVLDHYNIKYSYETVISKE